VNAPLINTNSAPRKVILTNKGVYSWRNAAQGAVTVMCCFPVFVIGMPLPMFCISTCDSFFRTMGVLKLTFVCYVASSENEL